MKHQESKTRLEAGLSNVLQQINGSQSTRYKRESLLQKAQNDIERLKQELAQIRASIAETENSIHEFENRDHSVSQVSQSTRQDLQRESEEVSQKIASKKAELSRVGSELLLIREKHDGVQKQISERNDELKRIDTELGALSSGDSRLSSLYGSSMAACLNEIALFKSWRTKPIGPLGLYVKLKETFWRKVMIDIIGSHLSSFIIFHLEDRKVLSALLEKYKIKSSIYFLRNSSVEIQKNQNERSKFSTSLDVLDVLAIFIL